MKTSYELNAERFAKKYGVRLSILDVDYGKQFGDDDDERYIFKCRLTRKRKSYTFNFGQSLASESEEPTMYDVLAGIEKYDPGTFEDFCQQFGYDIDSRRAERTYKAVCKEYEAVKRLFGDNNSCMKELTAIC